MPQDENAQFVLQKKREFEQALGSYKTGQLNSSGSQQPAIFAPPQDTNADYQFQEVQFEEFNPDEIIPQVETFSAEWLPTHSQDPAV